MHQPGERGSTEREIRFEAGTSAACRPLPRAKRALDMTLAGLGLLGSWPLWLLIGVAIKLEDGGPVLFRDRRVGQGGREFGILKFRTMVPDADRVFGPRQATEDDPRVTRVGRRLRATGMDELPQLLSILDRKSVV